MNNVARMRWIIWSSLSLFVVGCPGELSDEQLLGVGSEPNLVTDAGTENGTGGTDATGGTGGMGGTDATGGTGGDPENGEDPQESTCSLDVVEDIFVPSCALGGCHDSSAAQAMLDLSGPDPSERLFGVTSPSDNDCGGLPLADPADPDGSVLLMMLTPDHCGPNRMPLGIPLSEEQIACVRAWIESGGAL